MTKQELAKNVQASLWNQEGIDLSLPTTVKAIEHVMGNIQDALYLGDQVTLRGFGTFQVKKRAAKKARDIRAQKTIDIPAQKVPHFKPSKEFKIKQD